jgi:ribosome biogenesis ATPase
VRKTVGLNSVVPEDGTSTPASDGTATPAESSAAGAGASTTPVRERDQPRKKRVRRTIDDSADKYAPPEARLSQLGGLGAQVTQLLEIVALPLLHPEIYTHTGVPRPKGVLLHGVPGGGKTQLVRCLAGELGLPFITVSAPSIVSGMSGESERALRETFDEAKVSFKVHVS